KLAIEHGLQRVVPRVSGRLVIREAAEIRVGKESHEGVRHRPMRTRGTGIIVRVGLAGGKSLVSLTQLRVRVMLREQVDAGGTDKADGKHCTGGNLTLNGQVVLHDIGRVDRVVIEPGKLRHPSRGWQGGKEKRRRYE